MKLRHPYNQIAFLVATILFLVALITLVRGSEIASVVPGERLGPVRVGMSVQEYGALGELPFNLQDLMIVDQKIIGSSTNTGGSIMFDGNHVGFPIGDALVRSVYNACGTELPLVEDGDKYKDAKVVWFWFPTCGFGIRTLTNKEFEAIALYGIQAWAVFAPKDWTYINYIRSLYVDERGERM